MPIPPASPQLARSSRYCWTCSSSACSLGWSVVLDAIVFVLLRHVAAWGDRFRGQLYAFGLPELVRDGAPSKPGWSSSSRWLPRAPAPQRPTRLGVPTSIQLGLLGVLWTGFSLAMPWAIRWSGHLFRTGGASLSLRLVGLGLSWPFENRGLYDANPSVMLLLVESSLGLLIPFAAGRHVLRILLAGSASPRASCSCVGSAKAVLLLPIWVGSHHCAARAMRLVYIHGVDEMALLWSGS